VKTHPKNFLYQPDFPAGSAPGENEISLKWFGAAAYRIEYKNSVLWIDPYFSRHGLVEVGVRPLHPNRSVIDRYMDRADCIVIGHSHFDHAADLPYIVPKTGATVIGSKSVGNLFAVYGLPRNQFREVTGGDTVQAGPFKISFIKSLHGKFMGYNPFRGDINPDLKPPLRMEQFGAGEVFAILLDIDGYRIYHHGSGGLIEDTLKGHRADMVLLGVSSRRNTPRFVYRVLRELQPRVFIPTHYDWFFKPLDRPMGIIPGTDFDGVVHEAKEAAPEATLVTLPFLGEYRVKIK